VAHNCSPALPSPDPAHTPSMWHEGLGEGENGSEVGNHKARGACGFLKRVWGSESETEYCFKFGVICAAPPSDLP